MKPHNDPICRRGAFTLVETVLSIGIIAAVAIPAFTLMAVGSGINLESQRSVFVSQIVDQVAREVSQTEFSEIPDPYPLFLFDSEAIRLLEDDASDRLYVARVTVDKEATLPGSTEPSGNLGRVVIDVVIDRSDESSPSDDLFETDSDGNLTSREASRHTFFISRND